jgi:hypothetical protein
MSKVWFVTGRSGGLGAWGLIFCGLAVLTIALRRRPEPWQLLSRRASGRRLESRKGTFMMRKAISPPNARIRFASQHNNTS